MNSNLEHPRDRWNDMVVPAAKAWRSSSGTWLGLPSSVVLLFGGTCITRSAHEGDSHMNSDRPESCRIQQVSDLHTRPKAGR